MLAPLHDPGGRLAHHVLRVPRGEFRLPAVGDAARGVVAEPEQQVRQKVEPLVVPAGDRVI